MGLRDQFDVESLQLLCLDAGNTVIFLDHARVVDLLHGFGVMSTVQDCIRAEGHAKRALEDGGLVDVEWSAREHPGARGWGCYLSTLAVAAGLPPRVAGDFLHAAWPRHLEWNLFSLVPNDLPSALRALRRSGVKTAIVSNSEGILYGLFEKLEILDCFDTIVDSGIVGCEKPDPRIFALALERTSVVATQAVMLGDLYATDIVGARRAGIRAALIDPHGHFAGRHADVPRVASVASFAAEMLAKRAAERIRES